MTLPSPHHCTDSGGGVDRLHGWTRMQLERRLLAAEKFGFSTAVVPAVGLAKDFAVKEMRIVGCRTVDDALSVIVPRKERRRPTAAEEDAQYI
jgi:hypothetical protein